MVTVGLPHVAYVSVYVSRRLSDGWGCARWCSASCVCTGMRIAADAGGFGRGRGGFAGWVCAGMRVRLDVGGLALLPVVSGGLCMSWRTQLARCRRSWAFCGDVPQVVCVVGYVPRDSYDLTWAGRPSATVQWCQCEEWRRRCVRIRSHGGGLGGWIWLVCLRWGPLCEDSLAQ